MEAVTKGAKGQAARDWARKQAAMPVLVGGLSDPFNLMTNEAATYEGEEQVDGEKCYVFKTKRREETVETLKVSAEDGFVRYVLITDASGKVKYMELKVVHVVINRGVDDKEFDFTPPDGVEIDDGTTRARAVFLLDHPEAAQSGKKD